MIQKSTVETVLQQIANTLLLNSGKIQTIGLLDGKIGIAFFLYLYSQINKNKVYNEFADEMLDDVLKMVSNYSISSDFSNGLSGIGWGVRYMINKKYVEAGEEDILENVDVFLKKIDRSDISSDINNECPFISKGIYFVEENDNEIINSILNLLNQALNQNIRTLPLSYLNSILYVILYGNNDLKIPKGLLNKIYKNILYSIKSKHYTFPDVLLLTNIVEQIKQKQNAGFKKGWETVLSGLNYDNLNGIFNMGIYDLVFNKVKFNNYFIFNKLEAIDIENQIITMMSDVYRNLNLYNGLAGAGLTLYHYFYERK